MIIIRGQKTINFLYSNLIFLQIKKLLIMAKTEPKPPNWPGKKHGKKSGGGRDNNPPAPPKPKPKNN